MEFAKIAEPLGKRNVQLMGLSIDSTYSHIAWVRNIEQNFKVTIPFPVIADLNKEVATLYGMIMPGESKTETSRCVFVIDPNQIIRAMIYYPLTTGRNMAEILRLIDALQTTDKHGVATPANWRPGDQVIVPASQDRRGGRRAGADARDRVHRLVLLRNGICRNSTSLINPFSPGCSKRSRCKAVAP